jgi:hypothetical protein
MFERATELLTSNVGPTLWLNELDPLVATALESAIDGQIALLHVVRASLAKVQGEEARLLSENLSDGQLQLTIYRELRSKYKTKFSTLEPLDTALGIVPFGRVALEMTCDLFVTGTSHHSEGLLAAAKKVTIEGDASQIFIGAGALIEAVGLVGRADVDPTDAVEYLEGVIARHGLIPFTGRKADTSELGWRGFAAQVSADKIFRRRTGARPKMDDLHDLLDSLREFNLASARLRDVLVAAGGAPSSVRDPVLLVGGSADSRGGADECEQTDNDLDEVYVLSSRPKAPCAKCKKEINSHALVCRHCRQLAGEVWKCQVCKQPSLMGIDKDCRTFTCTGARPPTGGKVTNIEELRTWTAQYLKRWDAVRGPGAGK